MEQFQGVLAEGPGVPESMIIWLVATVIWVVAGVANGLSSKSQKRRIIFGSISLIATIPGFYFGWIILYDLWSVEVHARTTDTNTLLRTEIILLFSLMVAFDALFINYIRELRRNAV